MPHSRHSWSARYTATAATGYSDSRDLSPERSALGSSLAVNGELAVSRK